MSLGTHLTKYHVNPEQFGQILLFLVEILLIIPFKTANIFKIQIDALAHKHGNESH